nr:alpha/beta hydrolase [Fulvivirga aurantia]
MHYKIHNHSPNATWIIFLHGAGGSSAAWNQQWEAFKNDYNLLAIDLRDHGQSKNIEPEKKRYSFDLIARDIILVIDHLKIERAHFITLSFGSVLIQDLSMRKPQLVDRVVMAGGIFKANWLVKGFVHLARFFNLFLSYPQMYSVFSYLLMPKKRHQLSRRVYQIHAQKITNKEYLKWLGLYSTFFMTLRRFYNQDINFPALVVMGEDDFVFLKAAKRFTDKHENVNLKVIPKAGHICNIDNPKSFNILVKEFLTTPASTTQRVAV